MRLSNRAKKILFFSLAGLLGAGLLALGAFLLQRERLLRYALTEVKARVEAKYPATLTLGPARFVGLKTVEIGGLSLVPTAAAGPAAAGDTLLRARRLQASLSLRSVFAGRPVFSDVQIDGARLTARQGVAGNNFSFLLKKNPRPVPARDTLRGRNYGLLLNQVLTAGFDNVPGAADFRDFQIAYASPRHQARLELPRLRFDDGQVEGQLTARVDSLVNEMGLRGSIEPGDDALDLVVFGRGGSVQVPYVARRFGALVAFDTVRVRLTGKEFKDDEATGGQLTVRGTLALRGLSFYHKRLASDDIVVQRGQLDFVATLGRGTFALDPGTRAVLNELVFHPEIQVRLKPRLAVQLKVDSDPTPTNAFFNSLPRGMFDVVTGTAGTGTLAYHLRGAVDLARVDSLRLESSLQASPDFRITRFGAEDLNKLNTDFDFTAYNDKGDSLRTFKIGPSNPDFTPFDQVSPYLKAAILTSEDPRFFTHRGFMEKAFVNAAIQNIKERRFARGGSTLSMQLVKNVFLSRQKTIGRKAEEMLIVWLIENTRLVSKQRLFEIYLNLVEWGPSRYRWPSGKRGVYGVKEAALFYYAKRPNELNLDESLYLVSIIPKPKYYRQSFNAYGSLRGPTRWYFQLIANLMEEKGLISAGQRGTLNYSVSLNGPARTYIVTARDTSRLVQPGDTAQFAPLNLIDLLNTNGQPAAPPPLPGTEPAGPPAPPPAGPPAPVKQP